MIFSLRSLFSFFMGEWKTGEVALDHATPRWSGGVLAIKTALMRAPAAQPWQKRRHAV